MKIFIPYRENVILEVLFFKNEPDYKIIEIFISAVQKLVIKDVVVYAEKNILSTKKFIEK